MPLPQATPSESLTADSIVSLGVRLLGIGILLIGIYTAFQVATKLKNLLEHPDTIVPFATEIESRAHLNSFLGQINVLVSFMEKVNRSLPNEAGVQENTLPTQRTNQAQPPAEPFNGSYFAAWSIVLILLALIARISFWAIREGGKLALTQVNNERQLKLIIQELLSESRSNVR